MLTAKSHAQPSQHDSDILTAQQKENFARDGFLVLPDFVRADLCEVLMQRAKQLITEFEPPATKTIFAAASQQHAKHHYFLQSGDATHFFFEENAFDTNGNLTRDKLFAINKIGHAMHDLDPIFDCFSRTHKNAALVQDLGIIDPLLLQSMYICKQPFIGGEVNCHQDSTFLYVKEQPVIGLWFALEDATLENGCLWAIPGGHHCPLKSRSLRDKHDNVYMETYDPTPWPLDQMVPLEVPRGSLIVLHGLLPHMSKENTSSQSRHAYSLHVISGAYDYPEDNWLKRSEDMPLRGFK